MQTGSWVGRRNGGMWWSLWRRVGSKIFAMQTVWRVESQREKKKGKRDGTTKSYLLIHDRGPECWCRPDVAFWPGKT